MKITKDNEIALVKEILTKLGASEEDSELVAAATIDADLKGFTFKVTGKDIFENEFSKEFKTDKNGEIFIENLRIGTYTIEEVSNDKTKNYILPEAQTVEVKNGETIDLSFYNKLIEVPKTGDNSNIKLLVGIIILSLLGITYIILRIHNKNKQK